MSFEYELQQLLEAEEGRTVGVSFGGAGVSRPFSTASIRNWLVERSPYDHSSGTAGLLRQLASHLPRPTFTSVVGSLIRFSFLIELTDLKVGSTKMKTRWVPGLILMPQPGSFEPLRGTFEPGSDPRAASFAECLAIFKRAAHLVVAQIEADPDTATFLGELGRWNRVPYEFPLGYQDAAANPVHQATNVCWIANDDIRWLVIARRILASAPQPHRKAIELIESRKLEVKAYKTDRSLTGKDKTNRAKRWEILAGDFQHANLADCWSVERELTHGLINFENFPGVITEVFTREGFGFDVGAGVTRCPVTLAPLDYPSFALSVRDAAHGRSEYQIGHLVPLKRGGRHVGDNICWQSADGNRIQGDLTMQETDALLDGIARRRSLRRPAKPY